MRWRPNTNWLLAIAAVCWIFATIIIAYEAIKLGHQVEQDIQKTDIMSTQTTVRLQSQDALIKEFTSAPVKEGPAGPAGKDGTNGTNGVNGVDGINGLNGTNGTNGKDGITTTVLVNAPQAQFAINAKTGQLMIKNPGDDDWNPVPVIDTDN